ncbi:MAG: hypothetical protein RLY86_656 [Pseudomonadota bacterium]
MRTNEGAKKPIAPFRSSASDERKGVIAERLAEERGRLGLTQREFAHQMGVGLRTYSTYEAGHRSPSLDSLAPLIAIGVDLNWVAGGERASGAAPPAKDGLAAIGPEFVLLPRYEVRAAAGGGAVVTSEQVVDHLAFKAQWVRRTLRRNPEDLILIEANGDSMEPTIANGDLLLVDISITAFKDFAVYVMSMDGELVVKRIERNFATGGVLISSDNPRYRGQELTASQAQQLRIVGQVVWHGGCV